MREAIFSDNQVTIVGVLNLTPDSFSDGGRFVRGEREVDLRAAVDAAVALAEAGAHVLDVGGESTRPGAEEVAVDSEIARTAPVIAALSRETSLPISIDTRKAAVARAALEAGARIVNDVSGLGWDPELAKVVADADASLILGHMRGTPRDMQDAPKFDEVLSEVASELQGSVERALAAGIAAERIAVDPGIGFGKRLEDNLQLIAHAGWIRERVGRPILLGPSRKRFLGALTGDGVADRDLPSHAVCAIAAFLGVDALRVHDVAGAARAIAVGSALREARRKELS